MNHVAEFRPSFFNDSSAYSRAMINVGAMADTMINCSLDEVALTQAGVTPDAVDALVQAATNLSELSWVIARRTLSHRKTKGQRLTPEETGRWLRAAKIYMLANEVFANQEKAARWLHQPRKAFNEQSALVLMQTEAGARLVEEALLQIDAGFFA